MTPNKLLVITYYWPPSGGAGVQRWQSLSAHLANSNVEVHILTVDPKYASYYQLDEIDLPELPNRFVHKTKSIEPINWYAKLMGKKHVPVSGFSNVKNNGFQAMMNALRSRLFVPDPRKYWKKFALPKALELIKKHQIETVLTTSPPHSVQLIGQAIKQAKPNIQWIADFRDPWTDIYYYNLLNHSKRSAKKDAALEQQVLQQAGKVITVSNGFRDLFLQKVEHAKPEQFYVLPNGFEEDQFPAISSKPTSNQPFQITYSGSLAENYPFATALTAIQLVAEQCKIQLQIIGEVADQHKTNLQKHELLQHTSIENRLPHKQLISRIVSTDALLLFIPESEENKGIIPGKLFEYLATRKPIFAFGPVGSDVQAILANTKSGFYYESHQAEKAAADLQQIIEGKTSFSPNENEINNYNRKAQAKQLKHIIWSK